MSLGEGTAIGDNQGAQPPGLGSSTVTAGGAVNPYRRSASTAWVPILLLVFAASCSRNPTGTLQRPWVVFEDEGIDLGLVSVGTDTTLSVPLAFHSMPPVDLAFVSTDPRFHVLPATWRSSEKLPDRLDVRFTPTRADSYATRIQVTAGGDVIEDVGLTAVVWSPRASLHVQSGRIDFGILRLGNEAMRVLRMTNSPLASVPCTLSVVHAADGVEIEPSEAVLEPGESRDFRLRIECGGGEATARGDLEIVCNDPYQSPIRVEFAGECRGTPQLEGLPQEVSFGGTAVNVGKARSYTVTNPGDGRLVLDLEEAPLRVAVDPERLELPPGGSATVSVGWIPRGSEPLDGAILWKTNLASGRLALPVTGEAVPGILPAEGLGGIYLHMTPEQVKEEFGSAEWIWCEGACTVSWNYGGVEDGVLFPGASWNCCQAEFGAEAREIAGWEGFPGRTAGGNGIGSSAADIVAEFGEPAFKTEEGQDLVLYAYPEGGLLVLMYQDRAHLFDVFRPEDWNGKAFAADLSWARHALPRPE